MISIFMGSITFKKIDLSPIIVLIKGMKLMLKGILPVCIYILTILIILGTIENIDVRKCPSLTVLASTARKLMVDAEKMAKLNVITKKERI